MSEQKMTIARGLTRLKTITAQLSNITDDIKMHAAWVDKEKHPLGDTTLPKDEQGLKANHKQAREKVASMWQQYQDLTLEYIKIQTAINRANDVTPISIGDKTMTIAEAKVMESRIIGDGKKHVGPARNMVAVYQYAVSQADRAVRSYNAQFNTIQDENVKRPVLADVAYILDPEKAREYTQFINLFLVEFNATLNEVNAVTEITIA